MTLPRLAQSPRDTAFVQDPYPFYAKARALGPLVYWDDYAMPMATDYATVNAILRDRRFGREAPEGFAPQTPAHLDAFYRLDQSAMLQREPPTHTRLRGLVLRAFTSRRINALKPEIEALSHHLIDALDPTGFDLLPHFAEKLPVIIIARLLGVPDSMAPQLLTWSHDMVAMYQARRDAGVEAAAVKASTEFTAFLQGYIDERRTKPADDLITHLIAAEEDGEKLTSEELISTCILLLNAGHEATVHTIGNGVKAILENGCQDALATPEALTEEIMRFDPPLHMFTRYTREPCTIAGHHFALGDEVGLLLASAGRSATIPNPETFTPHRDTASHLALGAGLHFCLGAPLARLELSTSLPILFQRIPTLKLAKTPKFADRYHFHALESLHLTI